MISERHGGSAALLRGAGGRGLHVSIAQKTLQVQGDQMNSWLKWPSLNFRWYCPNPTKVPKMIQLPFHLTTLKWWRERAPPTEDCGIKLHIHNDSEPSLGNWRGAVLSQKPGYQNYYYWGYFHKVGHFLNHLNFDHIRCVKMSRLYGSCFKNPFLV